MSVWLAPAIMSVFGGIQGFQAGREMADQARERDRLAERNALLARRELAEQVRRQAEEDHRLRSAALARAAASGARLEGSVADYLDHMEDEHARQLRWMRTAGASRIRLQLESDQRAADALRTRARSQQWGSLVQGFTSAFGYLDKGGFFEPKPKVASTQPKGVRYSSGAVGYPLQ